MSKAPLINRDYRHRQDGAGLLARLRHAKPAVLVGSFAAVAAAFALAPLLFSDNATAIRHAPPLNSSAEASNALVAVPLSLPAQVNEASDEGSGGTQTDPLSEAQERAAAQILERLNDGLSAPDVGARPEPANWQVALVRPGDTLAGLLTTQGLGPRTAHEVLALGGPAKELRRIHPGDRLEVRKSADGALEGLRYTFESAARILEIERKDGSFVTTVKDVPVEKRVASAAATIDSSLFAAGQQAGLSDNLIMALANVFAWDVDFSLDIRKGDRFAVLYEEVYRDGQKLKDGAILAAEFTNDGRTYRAVRFDDDAGRASGYYSPDGQAMRKAFLRSPVEFSRISSTFSPGRRHPVLNRIRAHKGVDYAAPTGTPVKATGEGKIAFIGTKGGYGKTVVVQHGTQYSTLYAHLSRFARGMKTGTRVKQGEIIGYVGKTGLATGPHLHYEFLVSGVHRNPLTVALPHAEPLPAEYQATFQAIAERRLGELAQQQATALATTGVAAEPLVTASNEPADPGLRGDVSR